MNITKLNRRLEKHFGGAVSARLDEDRILLSGHLATWAEVIEACSMAATKYSRIHVVNDIRCDEVGEQPMRCPSLRDSALEGQHPDVLIIGGGISGASIAGAFQVESGYPAGGKGGRPCIAGQRPQ